MNYEYDYYEYIDVTLCQDEYDTEECQEEGCSCGNVCMDCLGLSNRDFM